MNKIVAIRGAITCKNTVSDIKSATLEILGEMLEKNNINEKDVCYVNFSATKDLNAAYPAKFAREECGFNDIPMMCFQEMQVENSLENCIRVLMVVSGKIDEPKHQYLRGANALRPDLHTDL